MTVTNHKHSWLWGDAEKIDYNDLKNRPATSQIQRYQVNDTRWTGVYSAWDFTVTTWFRPRKIELRASNALTERWVSTWTAVIADDWSIENWCIYMDWSFNNIWGTHASRIWLIKQSTNTTSMQVTSVTDTGFVMNIDANNWRFNAIFTVEW